MDEDRVPTGGQLTFAMAPGPPDFASLVVGDSNAAAVGIVNRWRSWPRPALCLIGAPGSGRTALAQAFAADADGRCLSATAFDALKSVERDRQAARATALDDADEIRNEAALLQFLNASERLGSKTLLTGGRSPGLWRTRSADLASRLRALPVAEIGAPDEAMMRARLQAAAQRRYMRLSGEALDYLVVRLGRSYSEIEGFIARLSVAVSDQRRAPTVPFLRDVLEGGGLNEAREE